MITTIKNQRIKTYIGIVLCTGSGGGGVAAAGTWVSQGAWDASTNLVPQIGVLGDSIKAGYNWDNGNKNSTSLLGPDGNIILPWANIRAVVNSPSTNLADRTQWRVTYSL